MPDAIAPLLNEGKVQLFCADSIDGEAVLNGDIPVRRRAEMEEKYFVYLTAELAAPGAGPERCRKGCQAVVCGHRPWRCARRQLPPAPSQALCRCHRPFRHLRSGPLLGAVKPTIWCCAALPLQYLAENGIADKLALAKAEENSLMLCAGQGAYEDDAKADTQALADVLAAQGLPAHLEVWGGDVSHEWYWWGKMLGLFVPRILEK